MLSVCNTQVASPSPDEKFKLKSVLSINIVLPFGFADNNCQLWVLASCDPIEPELGERIQKSNKSLPTVDEPLFGPSIST